MKTYSCPTFQEPFKKYLEGLKKVNYLIFMENPISFDTFVYNPNAKGSQYITAINDAFGISPKKDRLGQWQEKGILIIDILDDFDCNPVNHKLCKGNKIKRNVVGHENTITISFQNVINELCKYNHINTNIKELEICISIPKNTSKFIYKIYDSKTYKCKCAIESQIQKILIERNKMYLTYNNEVLNFYKSDVIGLSNYPQSYLIKHALNL